MRPSWYPVARFSGLKTPPLLAGILAAALATAGCRNNGETVQADQDWSPQQREAWYFATQGSRLMPRAWFDALERADADQPFGDIDYLSRFGFLPPPDGSDRILPIGFANDRQPDADFRVTGLRWYEGQRAEGEAVEPWLGLNCAACHTARMRHDGVDYTIDGGPSLVDFQGFIEDLDAALRATRADADKWDRFAGAVLADRDTPANRDLLAASFDKLLAWQDLTAQMNDTDLRYGPGRLDAVGHILNKILMFNGAAAGDGNPANAPVSYPFLWGIAKQERVQWNGIAQNSRLQLPGDDLEYGALGRNTGEVLGVFGEILITPQLPGAGALIHYQSSIRTRNLVEMELLVKDLQSPAWPAAFPAIDEDLRARGEALFSDHCAACHLTERDQRAGEPTERMLGFQDTGGENLTDIWMACNAFVYSGPTGPMQGVQDNTGQPLRAEAPVANMLATAVRGALIAQAPDLVRAGFNNFFGIRHLPGIEVGPSPEDPRAADRLACLTTPDVATLAYKARPLDGIWATAPYLHNGSVPSLYELLLPPDRRSREFWVGGRDFDPVNVGYVSTEGTGFLLRSHDDAGRVIEGNSNEGHVYGADRFSDDDRRALVEYMKSL